MTATEFVDHVFSQANVLPPPMVMAYGTALHKYLHVGPDHVASPDTGEVALLPALVELDQCARELCGFPLPTSAGFRTVRHEDQLAARGYKTAKFVSPHSLGCALDKDAIARDGKSEQAVNLEIRTAYIRAAERLKLPRPRLGHRAYGERFTHVDLVFLLFAPYTPLPHPSTWLDLPVRLRSDLIAWRPGVEW